MRDNNTGINEDALNKLILDIYNYAEKINNTLNQVSEVVDRTKEIYSCESAANYRNKFYNFKTNFSIVNKNIIGYAEDLIKVKNRYESINSSMVQKIKMETIKVESNEYK